MIRKAFLFSCCFCLLVGTQAQQKNRPQVHSVNYIGLLNGSTGPSVALQTLLGLSFGKNFAGLGAAIDYYRFRSIPLFADFQREIGKGRQRFFVYADAGYNFAWLTDKNKMEPPFYYGVSDYKGGLYYDAGLGIKMRLKTANALLFSAGYSYKKLTNKVGTGSCPFVGPCYDNFQTYDVAMPRLVIKAGWVF